MTCSKECLTKKEAQDKARWFGRVRFARMSAYKCRDCRAWHIGNNRKKPVQAGRRSV